MFSSKERIAHGLSGAHNQGSNNSWFAAGNACRQVKCGSIKVWLFSGGYLNGKLEKECENNYACISVQE
jgi:hypothetical protein